MEKMYNVSHILKYAGRSKPSMFRQTSNLFITHKIIKDMCVYVYANMYL